MSPIQNLILAFVALLATFFYPRVPFLVAITPEQFVQIVQGFLVWLVGWNVKAAALKSSLPAFSAFFKKKI